MTPFEFKSRFIELLPSTPPEFDLDLARFVTYPFERVAALQLADEQKAFFVESGFPAAAAPFLSFECGDQALTALEGFPDSFIIGSNNYGDAVCVDIADDGKVVYYNHDDRMKRVFINSSLSLFAESLCVFSHLMRFKDNDAFSAHLRSIDPSALAPGTFWTTESEGVMED